MTWQLIGQLLLCLILLGPGLLLLVRFLKGRRFPWWQVIGGTILLVWVCVFGSSISTSKDLTAQIQSYEARGLAPPDELLEERASDAHGVFALFLGWAFAIPLLAFWLILYAIAHGIRRLVQWRRNPNHRSEDGSGSHLPESTDPPISS